MKLAGIFAIVMVTIGCTHVRLGLDAQYQTSQNDGYINHEESFDTSWHALGCSLSFPLLGGWCWSYLFMPFSGQADELRHHGQGALENELGQKSTVFTPYNIYLSGYFQDEPSSFISETNEVLSSVNEEGTQLFGFGGRELEIFKELESSELKQKSFNHSGFRILAPVFGVSYDYKFFGKASLEVAGLFMGVERGYWIDLLLPILDTHSYVVRLGPLMGYLETTTYAANVYGLMMDTSFKSPWGFLVGVIPKQQPRGYRCRGDEPDCRRRVSRRVFAGVTLKL